jgi:hypothetical protein
VTARLAHREVKAAAETGVRNNQPEGIGRVAALGELVCWNNLGRNVVFADRRFRPRAVFGTTLFPDEDEPSQYDLDVHSILDLPELGLVVVLNHFGALRGFRRADVMGRRDGCLVEPSVLWSFVADVERTVALGDRLVGSAPRSEGAIGLLVSDSLAAVPDSGIIPTSRCAKEFGEVTALGVVPCPDSSLLAVGGDTKVALLPLVGDRVGPPRWEKEVGFRVASIVCHRDALWTAGPDGAGAADDYDWEQLRGGGFEILDLADGRTLGRGTLPGDVAWGTGGVAVAPLGASVAAVGRTGRLHVIDPHGAVSPPSTAPLARASLGIAHLAVVGRQVLCGFNRGGYRLHTFTPLTRGWPQSAGDAEVP